MAYEAIIFDLDDTLYLERDYAFSGFRAIAESYRKLLGNPDESTKAMQSLFDSKHRHRVFNQLLAATGHEGDEDLVQNMIQTFRKHLPDIQLLPDADAAITRLATQYKLGLITDGPAVMQRAKIGALGLTQRIERIIVTDDLGQGAGKPNPVSYKNIADSLCVAHNKCVYIADNPTKDFIAPNTLGWLTVQVIRPLGIYGDLPRADLGEPANTIDSLDDLDRLLL